MINAIRIHATGSPEVMRWEPVEVDKPGTGQVRLRQTAGLNYIDVYHRGGLYPVELPPGLGLEAAAVVEECGTNVNEVNPGDCLAYASGPIGAYAEARPIVWIRLPDAICDQ